MCLLADFVWNYERNANCKQYRNGQQNTFGKTNLFVLIPSVDCLDKIVGDFPFVPAVSDETPESLVVDCSLAGVFIWFGEPRFKPHVTFDFTSW